MIQASMADILLATLLAEIRSFKATRRSLGVVYAQCIGFVPLTDLARWQQINGAIVNFAGGDRRYLDHVKKIGWAVHEEMARSLRAVSGAGA
jgi:hypothetical protein